MTPDQRLDYFRSEFKGEIDKLRKELVGHRAEFAAALRAVEEQLNKTVHELKNLEVSVR